jgi:hypothetical protein
MQMISLTEQKPLKVLLIAEQCDPEGSSVPLIAWNLFDEISQIVDATLVTHERNRRTIERYRQHRSIIYISESNLAKRYYQFTAQILKTIFQGRENWPLIHLFAFPIYLEFDYAVYRQFKHDVRLFRI